MASAYIVPGLDLNSRTVYSSLYDGRQFQLAVKDVVITTNGNKIRSYKDSSGASIASYIYNNEETVFYRYDGTTTTINLPSFTLPSDFGIVTEVIDELDVLFSSLTVDRNFRKYLLSEFGGRAPLSDIGRPLVFQPGDSWESGSIYVTGFLTASTKAIWFYIPTCPIWANTITVKNLKMQVRVPSGGYPTVKNADGSVSMQLGTSFPNVITNWVPGDVVTDVVFNKKDFGIDCRVTFGQITATNGVVNNIPVAVTASIDVEFS
jgi:hypothetical protein